MVPISIGPFWTGGNLQSAVSTSHKTHRPELAGVLGKAEHYRLSHGSDHNWNEVRFGGNSCPRPSPLADLIQYAALMFLHFELGKES